MNKIVKYTLFSVIAISVIGGCSRRSGGLSTPCQPGMYCYKKINFGASKGKSFEQGVRDGCKTGEGVFTKDYYSSGRDKNYQDGWILGHSKCKQQLPNEGTAQDEIHSRKRAEYQIQQMRLQQESDTSKEENIVDAIMDNNQDTTTQDFEY
ncbi:MAG TPA: hypothetical protein ENL00_02525 [Nitratifractor sp.]|nr:hypothetical protein [Nitratifractor sp.]HHD74683.1 hypothetical protein [Nitratifractor sp.]